MDTATPKNLRTIFICLTLLLPAWAWSEQATSDLDSDIENNLTYAVAWKQTAAEYRALYHQGFNMARLQVELALAKRSGSDKPLAVVTDVDDTLLLSGEYWGYLVQQGGDFFDDAIWDEWIPENHSFASPGSLGFIDYCRSNGVEVFYVTSRDQGPETYEYAKANLKAAGFPGVDDSHLTVLRETSNKQKVQDEIAEMFEIVVYLGDNLNDFRRKYYSKDVEERIQLMDQDRELYGSKYILFPNPTDGHWIRAIYGESEPAASDENRAILKNAASRSAWQR